MTHVTHPIFVTHLTHDPWPIDPLTHSLLWLTICEMETNSKYVPAYHKLSDQAKVYEDFLHHDLGPSLAKL